MKKLLPESKQVNSITNTKAQSGYANQPFRWAARVSPDFIKFCCFGNRKAGFVEEKQCSMLLFLPFSSSRTGN